MALTIGSHLGAYQITAVIGAGGMGEVYKAADTRLARTVAIKVVAANLTDRKDSRERFDREARIIASLNHPHICTLYDVGHQDGVDFLVMEYIEGETLASRLAKGPLPIDQALRYAAEISDALAKAHRQGITHRDLKPGNVMLTRTGTKLLDFGLAKLTQNDNSPAPAVSQLPTASRNQTMEGAIIGTLQYMAPEQLEGRTDLIDARTDIFAFGALVYEMVTGKKAFEGTSNASLIAQILERDPVPMSARQTLAPPALERLVKTCLAKSPEDRCQSAKDVTDQLKWIAESTGTAASAKNGTDTLLATRRWMVASAVTVACVAAIAGFAGWTVKPVPKQASQPLARVAVTLPASEQLVGNEDDGPIALSPDGTHLVYVIRRNGSSQLYLRRIDELDFAPIAGTEGAIAPFFSPDGQWIGFSSPGDRKLKKVFIGGGAPQNICDNAAIVEASWGRNDEIIYSVPGPSGLFRVPAAGGTAEQIAKPDSQKLEVSYGWPQVMPGDKDVLFSVRHSSQASEDASIVVQSLETGKRKVLSPTGLRPIYVSSGYLVYVRAGTIMAAPFDAAKLEVTGPGLPVETGVYTNGVSAAPLSISDSGTLVYTPAGIPGRLVWADRKGAVQPLAAPSRYYFFPRLSPDGSKIAVDVAAPASQDIWIYEIARDLLTKFTTDGTSTWPIWTPDGARITYSSDKDGIQSLLWKRADGSGAEEKLPSRNKPTAVPRSWSSDGRLLVFTDTDGIAVLSNDSAGLVKAVPTPVNAGWSRISPDGHWLAYVIKEGARSNIYVQAFPDPATRIQISPDGGTEPVWNPNGRELFYRQADKMMAVDIATQPTLVVNKPRELFESAGLVRVSTTPNYDVSRDGQHFLMVQHDDQKTGSQIYLVMNWFDELKRRVPSGK